MRGNLQLSWQEKKNGAQTKTLPNLYMQSMLELLISVPQLGTKPQRDETTHPEPYRASTGARNELSSSCQVFSTVLTSCDQMLACDEGRAGLFWEQDCLLSAFHTVACESPITIL